MICNKCNFQNEDTAKFCKNCGTELNIVTSPSTVDSNNLSFPQQRRNNTLTLVMSILFVLALGAFIFTLIQYTKLSTTLNYEREKFNENLVELNEQKSDVEKKFDDLRETFPLKITQIELANSDDYVYGKKLCSSTLKYLSPKIYFENYLKESKTLDFEIHYYNDFGEMMYNKISGEKPSSKNYISTSDNSKELLGWGNVKGGSWKSGNWTVEIWYNDVCLGSKKFTILNK